MKNPQRPKNPEQIVYGIHAVSEALNTGKEIEKVVVQQQTHGDWLTRLRKTLSEREIPMQYLPADAMNRLVRGNHQGVAAYLSPIQYYAIESIVPAIYESGEVPLILVLDRITDVRNMGAVARTAECCGVHAMVIPARGSAQINADAIKTSSGALLSIPVVRSMNLKQTLVYLKESGLSIIAASEKSNEQLWEQNFDKPLAIIMGSEESGVSPEYLKLCDGSAMIPMFGQVASLNVSVATGMFLYEVIRQRTKIN